MYFLSSCLCPKILRFSVLCMCVFFKTHSNELNIDMFIMII